jgi:GcrA cell cycle regulator
MSWTDERVALLKKLWGEGKTAAEIAQALGGVTRNAVIGKAHRLKLSNRVSPIQQNKKPIAAAPRPERKIEVPVFDKNRELIDMLDLKPRECRWPLGDPREENFGFCGAAGVPGLPYCADHAKAAYQAAGRSRVLQAEDFEDKRPAEATDEANEQESKTAVSR